MGGCTAGIDLYCLLKGKNCLLEPGEVGKSDPPVNIRVPVVRIQFQCMIVGIDRIGDVPKVKQGTPFLVERMKIVGIFGKDPVEILYRFPEFSQVIERDPFLHPRFSVFGF